MLSRAEAEERLAVLAAFASESYESHREREALETALELYAALEDMVWQFADRIDNPPRLGTMGLSALEGAFETLGWDDPHTPEEVVQCAYPGCNRWATGAVNQKWTCHEHYAALAEEGK